MMHETRYQTLKKQRFICGSLSCSSVRDLDTHSAPLVLQKLYIGAGMVPADHVINVMHESNEVFIHSAIYIFSVAVFRNDKCSIQSARGNFFVRANQATFTVDVGPLVQSQLHQALPGFVPSGSNPFCSD